MAVGDFRFIEVTHDYKVERGSIFEYPQGYLQRIKTIFENPRGRAFKSVFLYDESYVAFQKEHEGSTAGFRGRFWADEVICDFDDDESVENAHATVKSILLGMLKNFDAPIESMPVGFSGNRGFHLSIPQKLIGFEPSLSLRLEMIAFAEKIVEGHLSSTTKFDTSIYKANGLIRIPGSCHEKTGLYKVMLTATEVVNMPTAEILELAKTRRARPKYEPIDVGTILKDLWPKSADLAAERIAISRASRMLPVLGGTDAAHDVKSDQRMCIVKIMGRPLKEGDGRNEIAIRLASHFTNQGYPTDAVVGVMNGWNGGLAEPLPKFELDRTIQSALAAGGYYYPCSDAILAAHCDTRCYKYADEVAPQIDDVHIKTSREVMASYIEIMREKRMITLGLPGLDYHCHGVAPGEVVFQVACSGTGKTTLMMFQADQIRKKTNKPVLILEQELHDFLIAQKLTALTTGRDPRDTEAVFRNGEASGDMSQFEGILKRIDERYEGIFFCTLDQLSTKRKIELIRATQIKCDRLGYGKLGAVFEDYLGRGSEFGRDLYEITTKLATGSKTVAKTCDVPLFSMVQARSEDGLNASEPLTMNSVRDSRHIFIAGDIIIGWWRPFYGMKTEDNRLRGVILKNRRGFEGRTIDLDWNRASGTYTEVDPVYTDGKDAAAGGH